MNPGNPGSRRKKIILYYFLGIVLPGIVLGYMAFRGIRNDQVIREKDNLEKLETRSRTFFSEIESDLGRFMHEQTDDSIIHGTKKIDPSILIFFVKDSTGVMKLITHQMLYPPAVLLSNEPDRITSSSLFKEGQRLEFAEQRFSEALSFYKERILNASDPEEKKGALVASARLYNKMNQPARAKAIYEDIRKEYQGSLLNDRIPLELLSGLEIMKINQAEGQKDELSLNLHKSLEQLLHPDCEYTAYQFEMFYQSFQELIKEPDDITVSLVMELENQRARTDNLIKFLGGLDLIAPSDHYQFGSIKNMTYGIPLTSGDLQAVYLTAEVNHGKQSFMVIDLPVYMKSVAERLARKIDPDSTLNLKIETMDGNLVHSRVVTEETGYLSFPFPENLPKWKLLLSENRPGFITTLLRAGSGIYLVAFILIILLMLLGFVFILYTLNVELRLNKLKSEFISNVSHELKSPLTSIHMMTEMLHHKRVENEERKAEYYSAMLEDSEHLSHLIDNILDFSRIDEDRKKYDFIDLDPDRLIREFIKSIRETVRESGFEVSYSSPEKVPFIRADRNAILQVLYNLVDNAIKFSGSSRKIDINLVFIDNEIQLSVKDYGIGISPKEHEKIFERFYRCRESQRSGIRGSGIGLTIVRKIVEDHGGYLTLDSSPGEGSMFTVRIPLGGT